jgi:hypothetical protein
MNQQSKLEKERMELPEWVRFVNKVLKGERNG